MSIYRFVLLAVLLCSLNAVQNIDSFGAIPHEDTFTAQKINQKAISLAIMQANSSQSVGDARIVVIPKGVYYTLPFTLHNVHRVKMEIQGKLTALNTLKNWPKLKNGPQYQDFIHIQDSSEIEIHGGGKIDGRGYKWWVDSWMVNKKYTPKSTSRPHLIVVDTVTNISIHDLTLKNSPNFHIRTEQTIDATIYNLDIKVNVTAQLNIIKKQSLMGIIPIFPLNTDGIDPAGRNFHIYNITCQNYDDVVVPKPTHKNRGVVECTQNMLIQNITVRLGVGLTIGTVPPHDQINCIRNITFRNVHMQRPFKGIYLKTNPGHSGEGIIDRIKYENFTIFKPIWWAVYLGPQQQKQPDGGGPGCMFYPFDPHGQCATQSLVSITNVMLKDITIHDSLLFPIVVRCNISNPCRNITFINVKADKWRIGLNGPGYVCENVIGKQSGCSPKLNCLDDISADTSFMSTPKRVSVESPEMSWKQVIIEMEAALLENPYEEEDDQMGSQQFTS